MNRRSFLVHSLTAAAALGAGAHLPAQDSAAPATAPAPTTKPPELKRPPPLAGAAVFDFVRAGHGDLPKVKTMLAGEPMLLNAMWDWGAGDWETALGGASHTGNREMALLLLGAGARIDAFCAAMLGEAGFVGELLRFNPAAAMARGPHGYTLLYHAGYAGRMDLAVAISAQITEGRPRHFNQSLQSAVAGGHTELVAWLLGHGVDNPSTKYFNGDTPFDVATRRGDAEIVRRLRTAGAVSGHG